MDCDARNVTSRQRLSDANTAYDAEGELADPLATGSGILRIDPAQSRTHSPNGCSAVSVEQMQNLLNDLQRQQFELEQRSEMLRRKELELEQSLERYFDLYQSAPVGYCTLNEFGSILDANLTLGVLLGVSSDLLVGCPLKNYVCIEHRELFSDRHRQLLQTGNAQNFELQVVKHHGLNCWVSVSTALGIGSHGEPVLRMVLTDISDRKETEAALRDRDRHLQLIACNMPGPVSHVDLDLRYRFVNPYYEKITGKPLASILGLSMREVLGDAFFESVEPYVQDALAGKLVTFPSPISFASGEVRFGLTTYIPDRDPQNQVVGFFVIGLDITSNHFTQQALATTTELLELTGQLARVGGWELDLRTNALHWTRETCRIHELENFVAPSLEEALNLYDSESQLRLRQAVELASSQGKSWDLQLQLVTHTGRHVWVRTHGIAVFEDGVAIKLQGALQDVTEQKEAEAARSVLESQLRESQKMEAIGTLAGGVAHDFNNILAAIMGNADLAIHSLNSPSVILHSLREIGNASERARNLVRQILSFSRPQATERKLISVIDVVEESIRLLRATLPARVALTFESCHKVPRILADATQLEQVILNLATNAYQALHGHPGCINIRVDTVPLNAQLTDSVPGLRPLEGQVNQMLRLVVADDGPGIEVGVVARLFEPFFTTKPVGEGTGLGLAVVHGIVRTYQGAITVESRPSEGATFTIYLPVPTESEETADEKIDEPDQVIAYQSQPLNALRILYVDDDQCVMQSIGKMLGLKGFKVEAFIDQMEAVEAIRNRADQYDLVVTDYNMPCLSGLDFARFVRATRSDLPVVVISGLVDDELRATAFEAGVSEVVAKPFSLNAFCCVVQRIIPLPS